MTSPEANVTATAGGEPTGGGGTLFTSPRHPERTCIGCGQRDSAHHLLRLAVNDGLIVADPSRRMGGRGAWLHPASACLEAAVRRRAFGRALRGEAAGAYDRLLPVMDTASRPRHESGLEADGHPMSTQR